MFLLAFHRGATSPYLGLVKGPTGALRGTFLGVGLPNPPFLGLQKYIFSQNDRCEFKHAGRPRYVLGRPACLLHGRTH